MRDSTADGTPGQSDSDASFGRHELMMVRLWFAFGAACLFLLAMVALLMVGRGSGYGCYIFDLAHMLAGPLELFRTQSLADKVVGGLAVAVLVPALFAWIVRPRIVTILLAIGAVVLWIFSGWFLAIVAGC